MNHDLAATVHPTRLRAVLAEVLALACATAVFVAAALEPPVGAAPVAATATVPPH